MASTDVQKLEARRERAGVTVVAMAHRAGVSRATWARMLDGGNYERATLDKISTALSELVRDGAGKDGRKAKVKHGKGLGERRERRGPTGREARSTPEGG